MVKIFAFKSWIWGYSYKHGNSWESMKYMESVELWVCFRYASSNQLIIVSLCLQIWTLKHTHVFPICGHLDGEPNDAPKPALPDPEIETLQAAAVRNYSS